MFDRLLALETFGIEQWDHEQIEGNWDGDPREWESYVGVGAGYAHMDNEEFDEAYMRRDIERRCHVIRTRTAVKDWLESMAVDWKVVRSPEQALNFVFEQMKRKQ